VIYSIKHTMRTTLLFIGVLFGVFIVAVMLSAQTAFAAFSFSSDVVGVGTVQSSTTVTQVSVSTATEKLDVSSAVALAPAAALAVPSARMVKDEATILPGSSIIQANDLAAFSLDAAGGDWYRGRSTVYDDGTVDADGLTCAVDISMKYLKGTYVQISYGGKTLNILVSDVGNLARSGYVFDFTPGVCNAFGFTPGDNPTVSYRFINNK
jgi:hypothetical protein